MGYESKLYIVQVLDGSYDKKGFTDTLTIATIDLCKVGIPLKRFFAKESGCNVQHGDECKYKDSYDKPLLRCTDLQGFIEWMEEQEKHQHYRRWGMAISLLKEIKPEEWKHIEVLHYGY